MSKISPVRPVAVIAGVALAIAGSLVATTPAFAAGSTYHVATSGDDTTGDGTSGSPFATIAKAVEVAVDGDTIEVGAGSFAGAGVSESLTFSGVNAGTAGDDWAGSSTTTTLTSALTLYKPSAVSGFSFSAELNVQDGAQGTTVSDNVFRYVASDHQLGLAFMAPGATSTVSDNAFFMTNDSAQPNSVLIVLSSNIDVEDNSFYGDGNYDNSVAVNLIGGSIEDVTIDGNSATGYGNFVVANANEAGGLEGLAVTGNDVHDTIGTAVFVGDGVDDVDVSGNLIEGGGSSAVGLSSFTGSAALGGAMDVTINDNTFADNVRGIKVIAGMITSTLDATGNAFYGNTNGVLNDSAQAVNVGGSVWAVPAGPAASGDDSSAGAGTTTIGTVSANLGAALSGATASTVGLTTTVHLGAGNQNKQYVVGGYGAPSTFGYVTANSSGDVTVVWPAGTAAGAQKIAVVAAAASSRTTVATTIPAATYTASPVPGISGHTTVGRVLTAITRTWSPAATLTFQWLADGAAIPGATSSTLTLAPAQAGKKITVTVTANRSGQPPLSKTSAATAAIALGTLTGGTPVVTGSRTVGAALTVDHGTWGPVAPDFIYRWLRDGVQISGAITATYVQVSADKGHIIQAVVKGTSAGYVTKVTTSIPATKTTAKLVTTATSVTIPASVSVGIPVGFTTAGTWQNGAKLTYQWRLNGSAVPGATKTQYVPLPADIGKKLTVTVSGSLTGLTTAKLVSNQSSAVLVGTFTTLPAPVITATKVGYPAGVTIGAWSPRPTSYRYQWAIDGTDVVGATKSTYTPTGTDFGKTLTVKLTAVRAGFTSASAVSLGKVVASGVFDSVKPKITGTARVGRVLTATTPAWAPKASTLSYQWKLDGVIIDGAVDDIYTVSSEDLGGRLTVTVTGSRLGYSNASETSNATAVVTP